MFGFRIITAFFLYFVFLGTEAGAQMPGRVQKARQDTIPSDTIPGKRAGTVDERDSAFSKSMDDIVISGTLRPVRRLESPVAVEVYTPQFFRMNPVASVFEAMQGVNGVRPQINCNICATGDIHINGMEGPYTMVTIDGMPIVSSLSSVYGLFGIPSQLIERVEVVKGPASGLYGSEAVGGLINIITRNPHNAPTVSLDLMASGWQEYLADAGVRWKAGKKATALTGLHVFHYDNPVDANADGFTDLALQKRVSLFQKVNFAGKDNRTTSIAARYFYEDRWGGEMNWSKRFRGSDSIYGESIYTNRLELIGNYPLPVTENIQFSWSYNYHHQDSWYGKTRYLASQHIGFGQLTWHKNVRRHDLLVGSAARYTFYDDNSPATRDSSGNGNMPSRVLLPGLFLQDEWKITDRHTLLSGLRVDHHPDHGMIFTPRLAFKWRTDKAGVFRLNAGTGFRVVNLFTEEHAALTGARQVVIAESLDPERSMNVNLNHYLRIPLYHAFLTFDASLWYTRFSNQIIPDYDTDPNQIIYRNLNGYAISKGASLNTEFNWKNQFRVQVGLTVQDIRQTRVMADGKKETTRPVLTESWSGVWSVGCRIPGVGIWVDYTGNIYGPMRLPLLGGLDPREPESPVWSIQNIQLTKRLGPSFELYGGIKNLLNWTPVGNNPFIIARADDPFDKNVEYDSNGQVVSTPSNPYALTFDPTYVYAPNQGRRLFLGFRYTLPQKPGNMDGKK
jgi:outer membrane receptor for ferrienterochelin and colicins